MSNDIREYYDNIARIYDHDRFANSYGTYIHQQEIRLLDKYLKPLAGSPVLDLACGTARLSRYATHGADMSTEMLKIARLKFPDKEFVHADASALPFPDHTYRAVYSMHTMMHLDEKKIQSILNEAYRVLQPGGICIFDIPSEKRRRLVSEKRKGWHGAQHTTMGKIKKRTEDQWRLEHYHGILFMPIHRMPASLRKYVIFTDNLLCNSFMKEYSSYLLVILRKK